MVLFEVLAAVHGSRQVRRTCCDVRDHRSGLAAVWSWVSDPEQAALLRLFFEAYGLARRHPDRYADFLDHAIHGWLDEPLAALDDVSATVALATVTGLHLDLLTTQDQACVAAAMDRFRQLLPAHAARGPVAPGPAKGLRGSRSGAGMAR